MQIIPSIDLQAGKCVRLRQGQFDQTSIYEASPYELVARYANAGAKQVHIVDLDGAKMGAPQQLSIIGKMNTCGLNIQAGGGVRTVADAKALLKAGVEKVVIGSIAVSNPSLVLEMIEEIQAQNLILALDVNLDKDGVPNLAINGWQTATSQSLWDVVGIYKQVGINTILCTDINMDGMMNGPNFDLYEEAITRFPTINWQASGGVRHKEDLDNLSSRGLAAAIIGRALYESNLDLEACFKER